ncbi:FAD-dependent oxidoreductase [Nocardioides terrisoli]|uniref:FAD-dependent oxidoreductase n=1 Tax=Nocardioides terrisoli TaxID=3388267 RepID=UPI00287B79C6|nr:FAD-dependent oxidoreductase [Nocardioides marmorisolisilvae]
MTVVPRVGARVAVIGSGVAGLSAAYAASVRHPVTLFEADDRLGGHADTHVVDDQGRELAVDTGFIVHNERTYPTLTRMFRELGVHTQEADMSLSVRSDTAHGGAGLEYAGARGPAGLFAQPRNLLRPAYLRMLTEVPRFHRMARRALDGTRAAHDTAAETLGEFLDRGRFSTYFRRHFAAPLVAAVWSCDPALALDYPAGYLFAFLHNHGMLSVSGSPQWRTVTGGSREYVARVADAVRDRGGEILVDTKVTSVLETEDGVEITDGNGVVRVFDQVVVATHPGQALAMLAEPTPAQSEVLAAMPYSRNLAQLHTDTALLPRSPRARASWNHLERPGYDGVTVTYDLTRLMRLPTSTRYLVTLGATDLVDQATVIATMDYEHPIYTPASVAAQGRASELATEQVAFAGAWLGWGFHEDGARSGVEAVARLGLGGDVPADAAAPGLYRTTITHTRRTPWTRRFTDRSWTWLVDLDDLPRRGGPAGPRLRSAPGLVRRFFLGSFEGRDHLGDPDRSIRANVETFLAGHGIDVSGGRILMAAQPRAFGYCFNPITVFWCRDRAGVPVATVVEVHNTYGDRHAYLIHPDAEGRARVDKQMYVSPFHDTDGHYDLVVPEPADRLEVAVRLITDDGVRFDASLRGRRHGEGRPGDALRAAPAAAVNAARIRRHGIALWLRRLPVRPRPPHQRQENVQ